MQCVPSRQPKGVLPRFAPQKVLQVASQPKINAAFVLLRMALIGQRLYWDKCLLHCVPLAVNPTGRIGTEVATVVAPFW